MKNYIIKSLIFLMCMLCFVQKSNAAWLTDYNGTLGNNKIGFTMTTEEMNYVMGNNKFIELHYYYRQHLKDIPLKLKMQQGRNIAFEEYDQGGKLIGTFYLTFAAHDPQNNFKSKNLGAEVLVGTWYSANGTKSYPVYLMLEDAVTGDGKGGRCDLDEKHYQQLQEKIKKFHIAVVHDDTKTLKKDFNFSIPSSPSWKKAFAKTVPHDLFCKDDGYMLGDGIVWFGNDGKIIAVNYK